MGSQDDYWSEEDLELIKFVRTTPEIRHADYKFTNKDTQVWKRFAETTRRSLEDVTCKWESIRKMYHDHLRSVYNGQDGKFMFRGRDDLLSFLDKGFIERSQRVTLEMVQNLLKEKEKEESTTEQEPTLVTLDMVENLLEEMRMKEGNTSFLRSSKSVNVVLDIIPDPYYFIISSPKDLISTYHKLGNFDFFMQLGFYITKSKMSPEQRCDIISKIWSIINKHK